MSRTENTYDVQADWRAVVPMGDTLAVRVTVGADERWVKAFEVVLEEFERQSPERSWRAIDFKYAAGEELGVELFVREIEPDARAFELRQAVDNLVGAANRVARVGTHVYELARELREPQSPEARGSVAPPSFDPLADELDADAA